LASSREECRAEPYTPAHKAAWDDHVASAKNATFLLLRDYLEYHADRFEDSSVLVYKGNQLKALMPANVGAGGAVSSHDGLTYGGLVLTPEAQLMEVVEYLLCVLRHLLAQGHKRLIYKRLPDFYASAADDDVMYALFLSDAVLFRRDCAIVVDLLSRTRFAKGRRSSIQKARRSAVSVREGPAFRAFWEELLVPVLRARHGVSPVHSVEEIERLASRFPDNIRQFCASIDNRLVAGATVFETETVAHVQYLAVSEEGRKAAALDFLIAWLIDVRYAQKRFFDFGICNAGDRRLNHGMLDWKEAFGGRCRSHEFYSVEIANLTALESAVRAARD
jgi:hypothetical protein